MTVRIRSYGYSFVGIPLANLNGDQVEVHLFNADFGGETFRPWWWFDMPPSEETVRATPQLFWASEDFARQHGGAVVRDLLDVLPPPRTGYWYIVDSKVHMLKPGWYPGIPGWHLDFAPGWETHINWNMIDPYERHWCLVSHDVSLTEYLSDPIRLNVPDVRQLNGYLSRQVAALGETVRMERVRPMVVYEFGQMDLHRVKPALGAGWRLFVRVSQTKLRKPLNEIRTQQQVYILAEDQHNGW